jgi:hypothetical protein
MYDLHVYIYKGTSGATGMIKGPSGANGSQAPDPSAEASGSST